MTGSVFSVLLVEDRDSTRNGALERLARLSQVRTDPAKTVEEARTLAAGAFYNLALVDLDLDEKRLGEDGRALISELAAARPACDVVLFTGHPTGDGYRKAFFSVLDPVEPFLRGALGKEQSLARLDTVVAALRDQWLACPVIVSNLNLRTAEVRRRVPARHVRAWSASLSVTEEELAHVFGGLFGQAGPTATVGDPPGGWPQAYLVSLEPEKIDRGTSAVYRAQVDVSYPSGQIGHGIPCIVKIGGRADISEEVRRYRTFVELGVAGAYRVELLRYALGDTVGGVCYSFGSSSDRSGPRGLPVTVKSVLEGIDFDPFADSDCDVWASAGFGAAELEIVVTGLFSRETKEWYELDLGAKSLVSWFEDDLAFVPAAAFDKIGEFSRSRLRGMGGESIADRGVSFAAHGKQVFRVPSRADLEDLPSLWQADVPLCLVHGDLHAGNVLLTAGQVAALIDYRNTGAGPRCLDFVSFETSVQLLDPIVPRSVPKEERARDRLVRGLVNDAAWDRVLWMDGGAAWIAEAENISTLKTAEEYLRKKTGRTDVPLWVVCGLVVQAQARLNFGASLTSTEYAATRLMYSMWLFQKTEVLPGARDAFGKLRLLLGMSELLVAAGG